MSASASAVASPGGDALFGVAEVPAGRSPGARLVGCTESCVVLPAVAPRAGVPRAVSLLEACDEVRAALGRSGALAVDVETTARIGTPLDASDVRREFRRAIRDTTELDATEWTPRELRHSFVSLLSDSGVPLEEISRLVGHRSTAVTELVYRKQIRPVVQHGATVMDQIFKR